jgi:hypothetical protein
MSDKDDYKNLRFNSSLEISGGQYNHRIWSTFGGSESKSTSVQLISLHESFHNELNNVSLYGNVLIAFAHLSNYNKDSHFENVLNRLVSQCRNAHEIYATFQSCSVISSQLDQDQSVEKHLLKDNPEYLNYYNQGLHLSRSFKGAYLRELALGAIVISCFQDGDFIETIGNGLDMFKLNHVRSRTLPDARLTHIYNNMPSDFMMKAFNAFARDHDNKEGILVFRSTEESKVNYKKATEDEYDQLQQDLTHFFIDRIVAWLSTKGYNTLSLKKNIPILRKLYDNANALLNPDEPKMVLNDQAFDYERNVLLNFTAEKYYITQEPLKAILFSLDQFDKQQWSTLSCGKKDYEHFFIATRVVKRLLSQYAFNDEHTALLKPYENSPLTFLRRRAYSDIEKDFIVEVIVIPSVSILQEFNKIIPKSKVISNVSLLTWANTTWQEEWLGLLGNVSTITALFDMPPHGQLEHLFGSGCESLRINKAWLKHEAYRHCSLVLEGKIDDTYESPLFFIPAGELACNVISKYIFKQLGDDFVKEDHNFMNKHERLIKLVMEHLFNEEYFFDFNV